MENIQIRKAADRGYANRGWLESYHSFSFSHYYDPDRMHFSVLRVINDDVIAPSRGFGMHPHHDMEIITYMLQGKLQHRDSVGNGSVIRAGDVQRMTAGTGVMHSEVNASTTEPSHLLQIWIYPEQLNLPPSYEQKHFTLEQKRNQWCLIAARDVGGVIKVHQDVQIYATILAADAMLHYNLKTGRSLYLQVARGRLNVNSQTLSTGDALVLNEVTQLEFTANAETEALLFDLPLHTNDVGMLHD